MSKISPINFVNFNMKNNTINKPAQEVTTDDFSSKMKKFIIRDDENKSEINISIEQERLNESTDIRKCTVENNSINNAIDNQKEDKNNPLEKTEDEKDCYEAIYQILSNLICSLEDDGVEDIHQLKFNLGELIKTSKEAMQLSDVIKAIENIENIPVDMKVDIINKLKNTFQSTGAKELEATELKRVKIPENRDITSQKKLELDLQNIIKEDERDVDLNTLEKKLFKNDEHSEDEYRSIAFISHDISRISQTIKSINNTSNQYNSIKDMDIINQISNKSKFIINKDISSIEIQLEPESLGKLTLRIVLERGLVTAKFTAQNEDVKSVIESNIEELKNNLLGQGLNIQSLSVSVDSQSDFDRHRNILEATSYNKKINKDRVLISGQEQVDNPYLYTDDKFNQLA
ncbi:flagellar hook-length control protein FliK [Alkalithermobacter paradoxus]|uniref:Flagellar hook-length control protein FliK n=1 Tax=Alkalithermobacter paradoxus TaxID=29349 RepID=A0A1V4IB42_9FIRM|nr:flagellar hook-length control protein FliK [[Clostridium] thermoalcaliphilum]